MTALPEIHKRSISVISKEELHKKLMNFKPGYSLPPEAPSSVRNKPQENCSLCSGTGWKYNDSFETWLVCPCTGKERPDHSPGDYTDV